MSWRVFSCAKWIPAMVRSWVADGGDGLQICRVGTNILNNVSNSRQGVVLQIWVRTGAKTSHCRRKTGCYGMLHRASDTVFFD
jgi:hypothetical protein